MDLGAAAEGIQLAALAGMTLCAVAVLGVAAILASIGLVLASMNPGTDRLARGLASTALAIVLGLNFLMAVGGSWSWIFLGPVLLFWRVLLIGLTAYVLVVSAFVLRPRGKLASSTADPPLDS